MKYEKKVLEKMLKVLKSNMESGKGVIIDLGTAKTPQHTLVYTSSVFSGTLSRKEDLLTHDWLPFLTRYRMLQDLTHTELPPEIVKDIVAFFRGATSSRFGIDTPLANVNEALGIQMPEGPGYTLQHKGEGNNLVINVIVSGEVVWHLQNWGDVFNLNERAGILAKLAHIRKHPLVANEKQNARQEPPCNGVFLSEYEVKELLRALINRSK